MSDRHAILLIVLLAIAFFGSALAGRTVIHPHANDRELGLPADPEDPWPSNRKFVDQSSYYIPELHHQLNGSASGWISTWNPHVELGRRTTHVAGLSKAYWPTWLLSLLSSDALRVYTWLVVLAMTGITVFAFGLFRSEGLAPSASLAAAVGSGFGVFAAYWSTFSLFLFGLAWTFAWLWGIRVLVVRPGFLAGLGVAVSVQGLLLSGYPQQIVWHFWLALAYTGVTVIRKCRGTGDRIRSVALVGVASAVGALAAAPVYLDLAATALQSSRVDVPIAFFLEALPSLEGRRALEQLAKWIDASIFGAPMEPGYPPPYRGMSLLPLQVLGLAASFGVARVRCLWPLQAFVGCSLLATLWPPAYVFGAEYLGLSLSRFLPLAGSLVAIALLSAHGLDARLCRASGRAAASAIVLVVGLAWCAAGVGAEPPVDAAGAVRGALCFGLAACFAWFPRPWVLAGAAGVAALLQARPLLLERPPETIHRTSALVEAIRWHTRDGSRFAVVDWGLPPLPNQEVLLGLRSIHSYNSLSSRAYQRAMRRLGAPVPHRGRVFRALEDPDTISVEGLRRAGVGLLVSMQPLPRELARPVARVGSIRLHRTTKHPARAERTSRYRVADGGATLRGGSAADATPVRIERPFDDRFRIELPPRDHETLVWVSQQYHPDWRVRSGRTTLETLPVDGFYLCVIVPPGTTSLSGSFEPWVRFAWIPPALFALALPSCAWLDRRRRLRLRTES